MKTQFLPRCSKFITRLVLTAIAVVPVLAHATDEIIVTSRKKEESLQEIPVSVSAFDAQQIERMSLFDLNDVAQFTPGLSYQNINGTLQLPVIRGLAQTNILGSENNVSNFLNGIYLSNNRALDLSLMEVARVEVIKGPQSALYGRNSFAGAISYITAKPTEEFEAYVEGTVGSDDLYEGKIAISGPLTEGLRGRIAFNADEFDGTFANQASSDNLQGYEGYGITGGLDWDVADNVSASLFAYYAERDNDNPAQVFIPNNCGVSAPGPFGPGGAPTYLCGTVQVPTSFDISTDAYGLESENTIVSLDVTWEINDTLSLNSLTGYAKTVSTSLLDTDATSGGVPFFINFFTDTVLANAYLGQGDTSNEDWSQEFRLIKSGGPIEWTVGLYWYDSDRFAQSFGGVDSSVLGVGQAIVGFGGLFATPDPVNNPIGPINDSTDQVETLAVFGSVDYQITDQFSLSGELRYTEEDKATDRILSFGAPGAGPDKETFKFTTYRVIGSYQATEDALLYASVASGARAGGFNARATVGFDENSFDEETNVSYEIGAKTEWFDNKLTLNGALYYVDWNDLQISARSIDPANIFSIVRNTGNASTEGFEIELVADPIDLWSFGIGYAYTNPEFDDGAVDLGITGFCGVDGSAGCRFNGDGQPDVSGNQLGRTQKSQWSGFSELHGDIQGGWSWFARADVSLQDDQPVRSINSQYLDSYTIVNARIGIASERLEVSLWAKNLTDEEYLTSVSSQPRFHTGNITDTTMGNGQIIGLTGRYNF
jgi:iron complex outermembrane receptor protein